MTRRRRWTRDERKDGLTAYCLSFSPHSQPSNLVWSGSKTQCILLPGPCPFVRPCLGSSGSTLFHKSTATTRETMRQPFPAGVFHDTITVRAPTPCFGRFESSVKRGFVS